MMTLITIKGASKISPNWGQSKKPPVGDFFDRRKSQGTHFFSQKKNHGAHTFFAKRNHMM